MKVIKPGKVWSIATLCKGKNGSLGCLAELEVTREDLYRTMYIASDGEMEHCATFTCCSCGAKTDIQTDHIPNWRHLPDEEVWERNHD